MREIVISAGLFLLVMALGIGCNFMDISQEARVHIMIICAIVGLVLGACVYFIVNSYIDEKEAEQWQDYISSLDQDEERYDSKHQKRNT